MNAVRRMTEMRSSHVDIYNHDEDAATYDRDVLRSDDPTGRAIPRSSTGALRSHGQSRMA